MNEEWTVGYDEGYQAGWNAAMDAKPAREWVGLTDEEKVALCKQFPDHLTFNSISAIEAKLREKNA